jgi:VanZ family protein
LPHFILSINDKLIHAGVYCVLGILLYRGLRWIDRGQRFSYVRLVISFTILVLYGISDEMHQGFVPGRTVDVLDATADAAGGILAGIAIFAWYTWYQSSGASETG